MAERVTQNLKLYLPQKNDKGDMYIEGFKSNFTIIDRTKHAIAQSYIPSELDATVSYPDCNFIFKNDNSYNVILKTHYDGSTLTVEIYKMNDVIV